METIGERYQRLLTRVEEACHRAGRSPEEVTIVGVSKAFSVESLREAYDAGLRDFGENYLQEALGKIERLPSDIRWHYTGRLQKRKAREIVGRFVLVHSLDSMKRALEFEKAAREKGMVQEVLIQTNFSREANKGGVRSLEELCYLVEGVFELEHVRARGLMVIPPWNPSSRGNRAIFRELRERLEWLRYKYGVDDFNLLSMGMSDDFEIAIEEGATHIRVGRALFGERMVKA